MERLYNHIADFGGICNDTGFAFAHAHCFRLRERLLRLNKRLDRQPAAARRRSCRVAWATICRTGSICA